MPWPLAMLFPLLLQQLVLINVKRSMAMSGGMDVRLNVAYNDSDELSLSYEDMRSIIPAHTHTHTHQPF